MILRQLGRHKLGSNLMKHDAAQSGQPFLVCFAVGRKLSFGIEQIDFEFISLPGQQTGYRQRVATVVARSGEHYKGSADVVPTFRNGLRQRMGSPFHQINGGYRFTFYRICIQLLDACCRKNLHIVCYFATKINV